MSQHSKTWFNLFASCIIVEGKANSLIYDVERMEFYDLSNDFLEILKMAEKHDTYAIKKAYDNEQDDLIDGFFDRFIESEIGFYTNEPERFPKIDFTWESPYFITNSIIEVDHSSDFNFEDIINQLDLLGCRAVQLRFLYPVKVNELGRIMNKFNNSRIHQVDILIPYEALPDHEEIYHLASTHPRLNRVLIYAAPSDEIIEHDNYVLDKIILYLKKDLRVDSSEIINVDRFTTNMEAFSEAKAYNLGLNRKVCINRNGEMKNYPRHERSFGNIETDRIEDIIHTREFQEKWFISNDKIEICRDCQYRYACVNNSDIKVEDNKYYKIDMCNFQPLTNQWKNI